MKRQFLVLSVTALCACFASAEVMDRPQGIKIGERMTLRPYVALHYTYDSNVDSTKDAESGSQWVVNPGLDLEYKGENWSLVGSAYYQYHAYNKYSSQLNESSYGESLKFNWTDALPGEKGWVLMFTERFRQIAQDDDMSNSHGRGVGRDRKEFTADGIIQRRLNAYWHAAAIGSYYMLDYDNNMSKYAPMYGWSRATIGGEVGFAPTKWTDFLLHASYQWYDQDNNIELDRYGSGRHVSADSRGLSLMAGIGSHATEKITYRLLAGWSKFEYAGGLSECNGFTYQASANWKVSNTLNLMLLGSSYYQPSEQYFGTANKVSTVSFGLGKSFVRGKLNATIDLAYRNESEEYYLDESVNFDENIFTARFGLNYTLNRFLTLYGRVEYQFQDASGDSAYNRYYEYDRLRGTIGVRLTY